VGGACNTHERDEKCPPDFCSRNLKGRDHSENLIVVILIRKLGPSKGFSRCKTTEKNVEHPSPEEHS